MPTRAGRRGSDRCARAASGQAAKLPTTTMSSRRRMSRLKRKQRIASTAGNSVVKGAECVPGAHSADDCFGSWACKNVGGFTQPGSGCAGICDVPNSCPSRRPSRGPLGGNRETSALIGPKPSSLLRHRCSWITQPGSFATFGAYLARVRPCPVSPNSDRRADIPALPLRRNWRKNNVWRDCHAVAADTTSI